MDITAISIINNKAVDLLRRGDLKTAANTFRVALELSLSQLRLCPTSANDNMGQITPLPNDISVQPFILQVGLPGSSLEEQAIDSPSFKQFHDDRLYLQTQGLYLTNELFQEATNDRFLVEGIASSFILYNLGLVSQLSSICGLRIGVCEPEDTASTNDSFKLRRRHAARSRSLYTKSRLLLKQSGVATQQATGLPLLDLLFMSLYNNSAFAAFADDDYDTCRNLFQELESFNNSVLVKASNGHWNDETAFVVNRYVCHLHLNALTLKRPNIAPSA